MDLEIEIRRLSEDNFTDFVSLFEEVFHRNTMDTFLRRKYDTSYCGLLFMGYLAYNNDGKPISCFSSIPCYIVNNGQKVLAAQIVDAMTSVAYRRQGLLTVLGLRTLKLLEEHNIKIVFGMPNHNNVGFFRNCHFIFPQEYKVIDLQIPTFPLHALSRFLLTKRLYCWYVRQILGKHLSRVRIFESSVLAETYDGVYRDNNYVEYQSLNKKYILEIKGNLVWISLGNVLKIGDISLENDEDFKLLMDEVKQLSFWLGMRRIIFIGASDSRLVKLFETYTRTKTILPLTVKALDASLDVSRFRITTADYDTF